MTTAKLKVENPATWNETQKLINRTMNDYYKRRAEGFIGYSLTTTIYQALLTAGHLAESATKVEVDDAVS